MPRFETAPTLTNTNATERLNAPRKRRVGAAILTVITIFGVDVATAGCNDANAQGKCVVLTSNDLHITGYTWKTDEAKPIDGSYLLFTADDVRRLDRGDEGGLDHLPQGYEVKTFTNPHEPYGKNYKIDAAVSKLNTYSTAINAQHNQSADVIHEGTVGFQFLRGACGLSIPLG